MEEIDYLIVGQGIAGSILGWMLIERGFGLKIIDDCYKSSASMVAAGILNPITGKHLTMSCQIEKCLPVAVSFYKKLENVFSKKFFYERDVLRIFKDKNELSRYENRKSCYQVYLGDWFKEDTHSFARDPLGSFVIRQAGNLDTRVFLDVLRSYFKDKDALFEDNFDYPTLALLDDGVAYKGFTAKKIIFCEGYRVIENPFFKHLKWELAKGDILTVKFSQGLPDYIINKGKWILPTAEGLHRVGATYGWEHFDNMPTIEGRREILEAIVEILKDPGCKVIDEQAGVRPATYDTYPFIGLHEEHPALGLFNGFGSKGTLLIPYYANQFADFLEKGIPLDPYVCCSRKKPNENR